MTPEEPRRMSDAEPTCAECGMPVRLVHRYPKGKQPERSHPVRAAARTAASGEGTLREALTAYRAAHSEWLDNLDEDGCPEAIALKDVLAATPDSGAIDAGIDVERLTTALSVEMAPGLTWFYMSHVAGDLTLDHWRDAAFAVAAEYDRLALPQPGEPT